MINLQYSGKVFLNRCRRLLNPRFLFWVYLLVVIFSSFDVKMSRLGIPKSPEYLVGVPPGGDSLIGVFSLDPEADLEALFCIRDETICLT